MKWREAIYQLQASKSWLQYARQHKKEHKNIKRKQSQTNTVEINSRLDENDGISNLEDKEEKKTPKQSSKKKKKKIKMDGLRDLWDNMKHRDTRRRENQGSRTNLKND